MRARNLRLCSLAATLTIALTLLGCSDATTPPLPDATATLTDPVGDTFGTGTPPWDVTALSITPDTDGITVRLDFADDLISPTSGDSNAMIGIVDFDVDRNAATGIQAIVDSYRPGTGSAGMGTDYRLLLGRFDADSTVAVDNAHAMPTGRVKPVFATRSVTVRIPFALLGNSDGHLNAAAIVGNALNPTDIIPENGHLSVGGS